MQEKIKKGLFIFLLLIILAPLAEQSTNFIHSMKLSGAYITALEPEFNFEDWWSGKFQEAKSKSLNDQVGFRPDFVRINNQIDYSLFSKLHFSYGVLGKNNTIWDGAYIDAYQGYDFIGHDTILKRAYKLKKVQDTLQKLGKTLVLVNAPNKAFFYPEYLPENRIHNERLSTNEETYVKIADSIGLNQIDFNGWFIQLRKTSKEILYTRQGIHWSTFGSALGADSLIKYLENIRKEPMQHIAWNVIEHSTTPRFVDNDLASTTNLITPICVENMAYPQIIYPNSTTAHKPKIIFIGDSFLCQFLCLGIMDNIYQDWNIWFYFRTLCNNQNPYGDPNAKKIKDIDWKADLMKTDCIVLLYTAFNLPHLGDGFIEQSYDYFYPQNQAK